MWIIFLNLSKCKHFNGFSIIILSSIQLTKYSHLCCVCHNLLHKITYIGQWFHVWKEDTLSWTNIKYLQNIMQNYS
jgi:hypothetical protein